MVVYFRRKVYDELSEWKGSSGGSTALLIEGARRVGKTTVVTRFAEENYRSHIIINFANTDTDDIREWMKTEGTDFDKFFFLLQNKYNVRLYERESLIVFDEVQKFPLARQMIKQFVEDGRYDYIETGSLISIKQNTKDIIIPSEEKPIEMHPMDFEEFLWAIGDEGTMEIIRAAFKARTPLGRATHQRIMNTFKIYMMVGGMPQAVDKFITTKNMDAVEEVKKGILSLYSEDTSKIEGPGKAKARRILESVPSMLSKHDRSFKPSAIRKKSRTRDYFDVLIWLRESKMVNMCTRVTDPSPALDLNLDEFSFKIYMADTGLLFTSAFRSNVASRSAIYADVMRGKMNVNEGMFFENVVAQELLASGRNLTYCKFNVKGSTNLQEVDFILAEGGSVVPVEVKSSAYSRSHASLDHFIEKFSGNRKVGPIYVIHPKDLSVEGKITYIPVYMVSVMAEVTDEPMPEDIWKSILDNSLVRSTSDENGENTSSGPSVHEPE